MYFLLFNSPFLGDMLVFWGVMCCFFCYGNLFANEHFAKISVNLIFLDKCGYDTQGVFIIFSPLNGREFRTCSPTICGFLYPKE